MNLTMIIVCNISGFTLMNAIYLHGNSSFEELKWLPYMSVTFIAGVEGEPTEVLVSLVEALNEALEVTFFVEGFWKI